MKLKTIVGKPNELKKINKRTVLNVIKKHENITRGDIVAATGISHTTVRKILSDLIDEKEIISIGLDDSTGGRRAERYAYNINKTYSLLILLEENRIIYTINNAIGESIHEERIAINGITDIGAIKKLIDRVIDKYKNIRGVGISVPGIVVKDGFIQGEGIADWNKVDLVKELESEYEIPIILENDLNAATIGYEIEYLCNYDKRDKNLIYIHFTTIGAGAGIMINGEIVKGSNNFAGEIGVMPIDNSYVNKILLENIPDKEYIDLVSKIIRILNSILNTKLIIIGGNNFRYGLIDDICKRAKINSYLNSKIVKAKDYYKSGFKGLDKIVQTHIEENIKILGGNYD